MANPKPGAIIEDDDQPDLSPELHWMRKGARIRAVLNRAIEANRLTHEFLARETGIDERQIGRCLSNNGGAHPPLALVACVAWHDKSAALIGGLAGMLGYDVTPRRPDLSAEVRRLRAALHEERERIDRLLDGSAP
jgi:hypothetical protein